MPPRQQEFEVHLTSWNKDGQVQEGSRISLVVQADECSSDMNATTMCHKVRRSVSLQVWPMTGAHYSMQASRSVFLYQLIAFSVHRT